MAVDFEAMNQAVHSFTEDVKHTLPVDKAVLFGSFAKGYATKWSDVDICFFLKSYNGRSPVDIIAQLLGMGGKYPDVPFEPLVFETAEIERGNPFVREILSTGIEL
jgi:hypothetical protein